MMYWKHLKLKKINADKNFETLIKDVENLKAKNGKLEKEITTARQNNSGKGVLCVTASRARAREGLRSMLMNISSFQRKQEKDIFGM